MPSVPCLYPASSPMSQHLLILHIPLLMGMWGMYPMLRLLILIGATYLMGAHGRPEDAGHRRRAYMHNSRKQGTQAKI